MWLDILNQASNQLLVPGTGIGVGCRVINTFRN